MLQNKKSKFSSERPEEYVLDDKRSPFVVTEAYRNLMANVNFAIPQKEGGLGKVITITSCGPNEGKSTVSFNLALTAARMGFKTIVVDCDMRKPHIKKFFNSAELTKGIVSLLSGSATYEEAIAHTEFPNLDALPCMHHSSNPTFLLNDEAFGKMIDYLAHNYEMVILDTPPINVVTDATIIGSHTDGVALIARQMVSNHRFIKEALKQLEFAGSRFLGFIWYAFSLSKTNSYGYNYKYNYNYKYGYSNNAGGGDKQDVTQKNN